MTALLLIAAACGGVVILGALGIVVIAEWLDRKIEARLLADDHEMIAGDVP